MCASSPPFLLVFRIVSTCVCFIFAISRAQDRVKRQSKSTDLFDEMHPPGLVYIRCCAAFAISKTHTTFLQTAQEAFTLSALFGRREDTSLFPSDRSESIETHYKRVIGSLSCHDEK